MKKTLFITNFFPPEHGGIQNYIYNLASKLPQDDIFILTDKQNDSSSFDNQQNFKIFRRSFLSPLRHFKLTSLDLFFKTRKLIDQNNIDLLIAGHFYLPALTCYLLNKTRGIPYYIFTHGTEIFELQNASSGKIRYMHKIFTHAQKVVVTTDYMKNYLISIGVLDNKILKISPGIDHSYFKPQNSINSRKIISKLISHDLTNYNIILSLGRLVERKGHDMVLKSLSKVLERFPKTKYIIAGDGPHREKLIQLTKKLNLEKYVIFTGSINNQNIVDYYNACDFFIMPSRILQHKKDVEGFGIVYLEASACEKPVIAGRSGGVSEAVVNGKTGLLINPKNQDEISNAMLKLMTDSYYAQRLGENGRNRVINNFDWNKLSDKLRSYLE